ncbi:MAG: alpha/beta hydrolase [Caldilineaceae bacterium]
MPDNVTVHRDIAYVRDGHERQKLDLFVPNADGSLPLLIWVHGGASPGQQTRPVPLSYLDDGIAVAALNYRLSQHALFPAQIEDVKAAVRWLRVHAVGYNLDPNRFGVRRIRGRASGGDVGRDGSCDRVRGGRTSGRLQPRAGGGRPLRPHRLPANGRPSPA